MAAREDVPAHHEWEGEVEEPDEGSHVRSDEARGRSSVVFPYGPLKDAEQIARVIRDNFGTEATPEQISAVLDASPRSGAFRNKINAARIFGAVSVSRGRVALTPLGHRLLDPRHQREARVDAFFNVELFKKVYELYKAAPLPTKNQALEAEMERLGVAPKQAERARWTFQKSAETAGFFEHGRGRLTLPRVADDPAQADPGRETAGERRARIGHVEDGSMPAPVEALWLTLLRDGEGWTAEQTHQYVSAARKLYAVLTET